MLIDWHTHVWLPEQLGEWGRQLDVRSGRPVSQLAHPEQHAAMMAEAGLDAALVIGLRIPHIGMDIPNEFIADYVATDPARLIGFASVCPGHGRPVDELRYAIEVLGLQGLKLSPPYQGFHPHAPQAWEIYTAAAELGIPMMFHQGAVFARRGALEYGSPALLDRVAREFPDVPIIIAHMGQPWYEETVAVMSKNPNVFGDISARFGRPWQLHNIMLAAVEYRVTDKVLFGTDFPVVTPQDAMAVFRDLDALNEHKLPSLDPAMREAIITQRPLERIGLATRAQHP